MSIVHNRENRWQDEARMFGLRDDVMKWIRQLILAEKQSSIDHVKNIVLDRMAKQKCMCCDLNHIFEIKF